MTFLCFKKFKNKRIPNKIYDAQQAKLIIFISHAVCDEILFPLILSKFRAIFEK